MFIIAITYITNWSIISVRFDALNLFEQYIVEAFPLVLLLFSFFNFSWVAKQHIEKYINNSIDNLLISYQDTYAIEETENKV